MEHVSKKKEREMVMLEVVHVTKRYRKVLANDDINLTIEDGRIGVLLGYLTVQEKARL